MIERLSLTVALMSITVLSFFGDSMNTGVVMAEVCLKCTSSANTYVSSAMTTRLLVTGDLQPARNATK